MLDKNPTTKHWERRAPSSWRAWLGLMPPTRQRWTTCSSRYSKQKLLLYRIPPIYHHTLCWEAPADTVGFLHRLGSVVPRWRSSLDLHFWSLLSHCNVTSDDTSWTHTYRYTQLPPSHLFQTIKYKALKKTTDRLNRVGKGPSTLLLPWLRELNGGGGDDGFTGNRLRSDRRMNPPLFLFHTGSTTSCQIPFLSISTVRW